MYDQIKVVTQLRQRWLEQYGETLAVEDLRRFLNRLLHELQDRELRSVFSGWSGQEVSQTIDALFDYANMEAAKAEDEAPKVDSAVIASLPSDPSPPVPPPPSSHDEAVTISDEPVRRRGGRPKGSKNKPK